MKEGARRDDPVVEPRRLVKLLHERGTRNVCSPFVGSKALSGEPRRGIVPPRRHLFRDGFDDENTGSDACGRDECVECRVSYIVRQLVEDICGDDRVTPGDPWQLRDITGGRTTVQTELRIVPPGFVNSPWVAIEPQEHGTAVVMQSPGCATNSGTAADIDDALGGVRVHFERAEHVPYRQQVERRVEHGKGRTLAGTIERASGCSGLSPLHVGTRKGAQGSRDLREAELGQVAGLKGIHPLRKTSV